MFRDLERLDQTGNFSKAAALGNLSQPAFSRRIKSLETWVGATLVDRSRHPVTLTTAGEQFLEAGLQALSRIETERDQIREALMLPDRFVVTFAAQHSIGWRFYPSWLQALEESFGPFLSRLRADDLPICMRDLENGDVDFVIAYAPTSTSQTSPAETISIGADQLVPVCKPDSDGVPLFGFDDTGVKLPFLRFGDTASISELLAPLFANQNLTSRLHTVYENSMAGALRMRARDGDGVAWLPKSLVRPDLESGALVQTGNTDWIIDVSICLYRTQHHSNRVTRKIWTFLESRQTTPLLSDA